MEIQNATGSEPVKTIAGCEESMLQPGESTLATEELVQRVEQLQQIYAMYQRKVIEKGPLLSVVADATGRNTDTPPNQAAAESAMADVVSDHSGISIFVVVSAWCSSRIPRTTATVTRPAKITL